MTLEACLGLLASYVAVEIISFALLVNSGFIFPEFPYVSAEVLDKFASFDRELGWCPQPSVQTPDSANVLPQRLKGDIVYAIDNDGGRICLGAHHAAHLVSSYGDSFCFCREVADVDTWQNVLAKTLDIRVSNFGVGNYGLDQSLLRLKRHYPQHTTPVVVLAVTPYTFERIVSVWKHYSEPGNTLAVKPRFTIVDDQLALIENVVTDKKQLMNLRQFKDEFRTLDEHYPYFKAHYGFTKLNVLRLLGSADTLRYVLTILLKRTRFELNRHTQLKQRHLHRMTARPYVRELFRKLVEDFHSFAQMNKFQPILVMMPDMANILYMRERGAYYQDLLKSVQASCPSLVVIDLYQYLSDQADLNSFYVESKWHYSRKGNELVAQVLAEALRRSTPLIAGQILS